MQGARVSGSYTCRVALPLAPVEERSHADEQIPSAGYSALGRTLVRIRLIFQCRLFADAPYLPARARRRGGRLSVYPNQP